MFAGTRLALPRPPSILTVAKCSSRIAWRAIGQSEAGDYDNDDIRKLEEVFVTSAFLDFGGVPTELLRLHELRRRSAA